MLSIANLRVLYDSVVEGVRDVSLKVEENQIVALLGANGSGKSTTLKAVSGVLYAEKGEIAAVTHGTMSGHSFGTPLQWKRSWRRLPLLIRSHCPCAARSPTVRLQRFCARKQG